MAIYPRFVAGFALLGALAAFACSSEPDSGSSGPSKPSKPGGKKTTLAKRIPEGECDDDLCNRPPNPKPVATVPALNTWCTSAASIQVASSQLAEQFKTICTSNAPTDYLVNTLIPNAFTGTGDPQLNLIGDIATSGGTVSAFFAVAIKMPKTAASHFEQVGPRDGTVDTEKGKITAQGSTPTKDVAVSQASSNGDPSWLRGWTVNSASTADVGNGFPKITVKTAYTYRIDHFKVGTAGYLYTSVLQSSKETVKNYQILDAVFDYQNSGYQIIVAKISADDKGQAAKVSDAVRNIASKLVKYLYDQSAK